MKEFYLGAEWDEMLSSFVTTPATLIHDNIVNNNCENVYNVFNIEFNIEFNSGFFPPYLSDSDEIHMNIGYIIREDQKIKKDKLKKFYIRQGVSNNGFSLIIPKQLQKKTTEILDVFDSYSYSYFGVDPEEEERKQYYLDLGVKKEKMVYSYKVVIPKSLENDENKITEIKKLFNCYKAEFY